MSQTWSKDYIQALLDSSDKAVVKALKIIYARQTAAEQSAQQTQVHNNRGFTAFDAKTLTDIAQRLPRYNDRLTKGQLTLCRTRLKKYWRQLLEEIPVENRAMSDKAVVALAGGRVKPGITTEADTPARHKLEGAFA